MLETEAAKATARQGQIVTTGANAITERFYGYDYISTSQTTTSTSYTNLSTVGPTVTLATGTQVLLIISCKLSQTTVGTVPRVSFAVSGASTIAAPGWGLLMDVQSSTMMTCSQMYVQDVTAGTNTFQLKYKVDANTGTFATRRLIVIPF
jgi:hypothetical protein